MKKNMKFVFTFLCRILALVMLFSPMSASAVQIDMDLYSFSTKGPDRYADGAFVADGETYILLGMKSVDSIWTIDNTGAADGAEILWRQSASAAACPEFHVQIPENSGLVLRLVLLDTRGPDGRPDIANGVFGVSLPLEPSSYSQISADKKTQNPVTMVSSGKVALRPSSDFEPPAVKSFGIKDGSAAIGADAYDIGDYTIQESDDMVSWTPVKSNIRAKTLRDRVTVPCDVASVRKFYRIVSNLIPKEEGSVDE